MEQRTATHVTVSQTNRSGWNRPPTGANNNPIDNSISRVIEHNADVYGQEAVHGIIADPQAVGRQTFQVIGEESLDDPTPNPFFEFWFDGHPSTRYRAAFSEAYDPWTAGESPKYFAK